MNVIDFIHVRTIPLDAGQQDLILESESGQIQICLQLPYPRNSLVARWLLAQHLPSLGFSKMLGWAQVLPAEMRSIFEISKKKKIFGKVFPS